jgi:hypothetical protein
MKKSACDLSDEIRVLMGIVDKTTKLIQHLDTQTNILIGISSAIFVFMTAGLKYGNLNIPLLVLGVFSAIAALTGLFAIHPPRFMRKKGQQESLMYNKNIGNFQSSAVYQKKLEKVFESREALLKQYAMEIHNLAKYYYQPKRKIFKLSRNILLTGIILSIFISLLSFAFLGNL